MSLASINLFILALSITSANPRVGRGGNLALALFIFVAYFNMINIGQGWISNGKVSFWNLIIFMHGGMSCLAIALLFARHNNWTWRRLIALRRAAA